MRKSLLVFATAFLLLFPSSLFAASRIFFDGSEASNTDLWGQDGFRNRCTSVTSAADGVTGPHTGSRMIRCNSNGTVSESTAPAYETLTATTTNYTSELFLRMWFRIDTNAERTWGSPQKILRFFQWDGSTYHDLFGGITPKPGADPTHGLNNATCASTGGAGCLPSYWGDASGDDSVNSSGWHKIEYYINQSGSIKVWNDDILVRNATGLNFGGQKWNPFYLTSNWSDSHGATNYTYYDDIEIFSDVGSGATGTMSAGDIAASGGSTHTITMSSSGEGTVTSSPTGINCGATCAASFADTTVVTLSHSEPSGVTFTSWSGGGCSGTGTCQITVSADVTVTATFSGSSSSHTITAVKAGAGAASGMITSSPSGISCGSDCAGTWTDGTAITLSHAESAGVTFSGWSGCGCSGTGTCDVTISADETCTGTFAGAPSLNHVQSSAANGGPDTSISLAYTLDISPGSLLLAAGRVGGVDQLSTVSDTKGNTWILVKKQAQGSDHYLYLYCAANVLAGPTTVTFTTATSQTLRLMIHEYAGLKGTCTPNQTTSAEGTGTSVSSGSVTTTVADELVFSVASVAGAKTFTEGTNFTKRQEIVQKTASEDRVVSSTGSYAGTWTLNASDSWAAIVAAFEEAPPAAPVGLSLTGATCSGCSGP